MPNLAELPMGKPLHRGTQADTRYELYSPQAKRVASCIDLLWFAFARAAAGASTFSANPVEAASYSDDYAELEIGDDLLAFEPPLKFEKYVAMRVQAIEFPAPPSDFD